MTTRCIEICNAFAPGRKTEMGISLEILGGQYRGHSLIELVNGTWLCSYGDGRYTTDGDEFERWAQVQVIERDNDGEIVSGQLLGYTRV